MSPNSNQVWKEFLADIIYKSLTGLTRSEEASLNYYGMKLEKQKATEEQFKKFSLIYAGHFIDSLPKKKDERQKLTDDQTNKLMKKALDKAWEEYNGQN